MENEWAVETKFDLNSVTTLERETVFKETLSFVAEKFTSDEYLITGHHGYRISLRIDVYNF